VNFLEGGELVVVLGDYPFSGVLMRDVVLLAEGIHHLFAF
jgi:hypothetical protein